MIKKMISFLLVLSILFLCIIPAFADDEYISSISTFWDEALTLGNEAADFLKLPFKQTVVGTLAFIGSQGEVCPYYADGRHRCSDYSHSNGRGVDENGSYILLLCDHGDSYFKCYDSDFQDAYSGGIDATYGELSNIASDGGLIWQPTWKDAYGQFGNYHRVLEDNNIIAGDPPQLRDNTPSSFSYTFYDNGWYVLAPNGANNFYIFCDGTFGFHVPVTGTYYRQRSPMVNYTCIYNKTEYHYTPSYTEQDGIAVSAGDSLTLNYSYSFNPTYFEGFAYFPIYKIVPTVSTSQDSNYSTGTRAGSLSLNLATTSTVNNVTTIENVYNNTQIVNETNNTIYDPTSGSTFDIADWVYDYLTRTYTGTLTDGSAFTVNYADDLVRIDLGGVTLELHYTVENEAPPACQHEYAATDRIEPTCTEDGRITYTCIKCGDTYSESIPALGHAWHLKETVPDSYVLDEVTLVCPNCNGTDISYEMIGDGPMFSCTCRSCDNTWSVAGSTVAGYDLYECSRCGMTYKDYTGEGVDRSDSAYWAWLQWWLTNFQAWLDGKLDGLDLGSGGGTSLSPIVIAPNGEIKPDVDIDVDLGDGSVSPTSLLGILAKFAWVVEVWNATRYLVSVISSDAASAYHFEWTLGGDALEEEWDEGLDLPLDGESASAPSLTIELGEASASWFPGGTVKVIDFSWYAQYKPTVDSLLSGILWAVFIWAVFKKAPGIIQGASMDANKLESLSRRRGE